MFPSRRVFRGIAGIILCAISVFEAQADSSALGLYPEFRDLGNIQSGEVRTVKLEIRNPTLIPVAIESITASCGCTSVTVSQKEISPESSIDAYASIDSSGRGGNQVVFISVVWRPKNGKSSRTIESKIIYFATHDYFSDPSKIEFKECEFTGTPKERNVKITLGNSGFKWKTIKAETDSADLSVVKINESSDEANFIVTFWPSKSGLGHQKGQVVFHLIAPNNQQRIFRLHTHAIVNGYYQVVPRTLYFGKLTINQSIDGTFLLTSISRSALQTPKLIDHSNSTTEFRFFPGTSIDGRISVKYRFKAPSKPGIISGFVSAIFSTSPGEQINVPYIGYVDVVN